MTGRPPAILGKLYGMVCPPAVLLTGHSLTLGRPVPITRPNCTVTLGGGFPPGEIGAPRANKCLSHTFFGG